MNNPLTNPNGSTAQSQSHAQPSYPSPHSPRTTDPADLTRALVPTAPILTIVDLEIPELPSYVPREIRLASYQYLARKLMHKIISCGGMPDDRPRWHCHRCGYDWRGHTSMRVPKACARCKSAYWNDPVATVRGRVPDDPPNPKWASEQRKRTLRPMKKLRGPAALLAPNGLEDVSTRAIGIPPPPGHTLIPQSEVTLLRTLKPAKLPPPPFRSGELTPEEIIARRVDAARVVPKEPEPKIAEAWEREESREEGEL